MKKNEYVSPKMEIMELTMQCCVLGTSEGGTVGGDDDNNGKAKPTDPTPWG